MKIITTLQQCERNDGTLRNDDNDVLKRWLTRTTSQTSATMQNKLLMIMAHMVLRDICQKVDQLAVTVDARRMSSGWSRMLYLRSICGRCVRGPRGLYNVSEPSGASLSNMLQDQLPRHRKSQSANV